MVHLAGAALCGGSTLAWRILPPLHLPVQVGPASTCTDTGSQKKGPVCDEAWYGLLRCSESVGYILGTVRGDGVFALAGEVGQPPDEDCPEGSVGLTALLDKEIVVVPGNAVARYTVPMPDDSRIPDRNAEEMALNGSVLSTVISGGPCKTELRTFRWEVTL